MFSKKKEFFGDLWHNIQRLHDGLADMSVAINGYRKDRLTGNRELRIESISGVEDNRGGTMGTELSKSHP